MSRLTTPKNPFQALDHDYTRLHSQLVSRDTLPKSQIFHCPKSFQFNSYFFPSLGQPEPFRAKKTQTNPNLIKTLSFDRNITWTISDPKEPVKTVHFIATYQVCVPLQSRFLNLKRKKNWKRIMIFPSCIWDIWINPNKRNPYKRNEKSENSRKRKIWSD